MSLHIRVPATTANLGAGVDCLGAALTLYLDLTVRPAEETAFSFSFPDGEGALPDGDNLILQAMRLAAKETGRALPPFFAEVKSGIPLSRGLGSSASAAVAGLAAGFLLLGEEPDKEKLLTLSTRLEGHPDNASPAVYGGFTAAFGDEDGVYAVSLPAPPLKAVVAVPDFHLSTKKMREALPESVPLRDAVANVQRAAYFVAALVSGKTEDLSPATEDRLFTPARKPFMPYFDDAVRAAKNAGARGCMISGAGPSLFSLAEEKDAPAVAAALTKVFEDKTIPAKVLTLDFAAEGVRWAKED